MTGKCEYCGGYITEKDSVCPHCGATNPGYQRQAKNAPKTIEELKEWYTAHNLPPEEVTRFFIGKDIKEARAFGIFEKDGQFTVYKNKSDGQRAVRYEGTDEAYAVNEIYQKLKSEIANQKANQNNRRSCARTKNRGSFAKEIRNKIVLWTCILLVAGGVGTFIDRHDGYYKYQNKMYYSDSGKWYYYDDYYDTWTKSSRPFESDQYDTYSVDESVGNAEVGQNFKDSEWYSSSSDSDDWDSGSSWDSSDSWDSGGSDWDSDW